MEDCHGDHDDLGDFFDNLHKDELCIITEQNDLNTLRALKQRAMHDVEDTAKALALE